MWDYEQDSITLTFNYNKENDIYEFVYYCHKLIDIAFLQFNFLFLSEEGLMDYNGRNVNNLQHLTESKKFVVNIRKKKRTD